MRILSAEFVKSAATLSDWPQTDVAEIAFCGRSNVGKSTLINHIIGRRAMARVSNTPGRTRLLNFFFIQARTETPPKEEAPTDFRFMLVDLPGFGYAKVSKTERDTWRPAVEAYFTKRTELICVILLFDSRRVLLMKDEPDVLKEEIDLFFYLIQQQKQVLPVITKVDQVPKHQQKPMMERLYTQLGQKPLLFSSLHQEGMDKLHRSIENTVLFHSTKEA